MRSCPSFQQANSQGISRESTTGDCMAWSRRIRLGVPDLVFGLVLVTILIRSQGLLNDPGTFWHARLGREIASTGAVPRVDTLTYTRDHVAWVDQSWGFDLLLAAVVDRWGWSAAVAATALGLATFYATVIRGLVREGASPMIAVVVIIPVFLIGTIHFLVRPHLLTFAFAWWTMRACRAQHDRGGWAIAIVPLLMVGWANVHGGFLAGPFIVLTAAFGHAFSGPWDKARQRNLEKYAAVLVLSLLTPLANPYGIGLYRHVANLLFTSGVTTLIVEFQPIQFGSGQARVVEWVLMALIALPCFTTRRMDRYNLVQTLVWLHLALASVRYAPIFALAMAPGLVQLLDGLSAELRSTWQDRMTWSVWPVAMALAVVLMAGFGARFGDFDPTVWPIDAVASLNRQRLQTRLFHEQDWGGMIASECRPPRRSFIDDRFELFGKAEVLQYADALHGGPVWEAIRDRERIELVWVRPTRGLARLLTGHPDWKILHRDAVSILFRREAGLKPECVSSARLDRPEPSPVNRTVPPRSQPMTWATALEDSGF
ncbi:hypothetical protein SAMN05444166_1651 [Singulisphaera sp. GP187]|nr:hypothetical protein SAMN05444166_1651 [Singulisphaera sp. GP187]